MTRDADALITLDEAAKLIPGADANTLKRLCHKGVLTCYRPGKAYLTTVADVREAIKKCQVGQKASNHSAAPMAPAPLGSSSMDLGNAALDLALAQASARRRKR